LIIVWKTIGCFSCLINNASTSTVDLATENILVSTQFFGQCLKILVTKIWLPNFRAFNFSGYSEIFNC
jgi:hypothetical protein